MTLWEFVGLLAALSVLSLMLGFGWQKISERRSGAVEAMANVLRATREAEAGIRAARMEIEELTAEIEALRR